MRSVDVAILGVSGTLGQEYVRLLVNHPFFRIRSVTGYSTVGKTLAEVSEDVPERVGSLEIQPTNPKKVDADIVFSPLPTDVARSTEEEFAKAGFTVVTDASPHRMDADIPLIIPEVNPEQLSLLETQKAGRRWDGMIVATPNCTTVGVAITLKPLEPFGVKSVVATTMQAISGAGYPGVPSLDITDNLIPFIAGEEDKVVAETNKILGRQADPVRMAVTTTRVSVIDGHTVSMHVELRESVKPEDVAEEMARFSGRPQQLRLPTAPEKPIRVLKQSNRPQPRLDRDAGSVPGMTVSVGRIRSGLDARAIQYVHVSNNVIRGGAGGAILTAELMVAEGFV